MSEVTPTLHRGGPERDARGGALVVPSELVPGQKPELASVAPVSFPIVGIGASAGGLAAFRQLLGNLPLDTGMAYVLVQHLDPNQGSILTELLAQSTRLEVSEVQGDVRVAPDRIYVIPPSKGLILSDGTLKLVPRSPVGSVPMPIDSFLRTLADVQGSQAIGVILSGMGSDGTLGLQAIEAAGGITFAQEPASAKNEDMPLSAIRSVSVDYILPPEDIARELARLGRHPYLASEGTSRPSIDARVGVPPDDEGSLALIIQRLQQTSGTDFSGYEKATLRRRIARRMAVSRIDSLRDYALHLEGDSAEAQALHADCLISVTSFFRDPAVFQALSDHVIPRLLKRSAFDEPLRMWVPGCATGEEVYSIVMCLLERTAALSENPSLQIFATDLSESALAKARDGSYPTSVSRDVSAERLRRFFTKVGDQYQVNKALREICVFARHDLTRDPPYSRMDLISCRNVLIDLEPALQEVLFATFHYALRPEGVLIVGPAETVGSSPLFSPIHEKHRIYARNGLGGPARALSVQRHARRSEAAAPQPDALEASGASEVSRETDRILLERFGPAGVVVDSDLHVLEFRGDTDPFLDHSRGRASLNLDHLLRRGLLMESRQAIEEARRSGASVKRHSRRVSYRGELRSVAVEVVPIQRRADDPSWLLVLFRMEEGPARARLPTALPAPEAAVDARDHEILRLGQGLAETTEYMHTLVREHESALEELQSTTEEALSGNEELQSLNEELQTAKEEIQSANEELATLNQELQDRNGQLARFNDDIQHGLDNANALVEAVPQPLVILDGELRVEKANLAFYTMFELTAEQTRGRLITEIGEGWLKPALIDALRQVLDRGATVKGLEIEAEFPGLGVRDLFLQAQPLHAGRGSRGRILLAIEDRTEVTRAARGRAAMLALEHDARQRAEAADHLKDQFVATVSHELRGPLNVISGWMNILVAAGQSPEPAMLTRALGAIGRGVAAQTRLLSDLIDHSRIVTGKVELQRETIDLMTVAEAALVGVRAAADAKEIELILSGDRSSSRVLGDFDRMQQVLWNLFLNAVKFTPRGGVVRTTIGREGNQVQITVCDSGRGIAEDFLPHVFDRFRQADGSSTRAQQGLGLGLTLVRELVELHGGTVHASSGGEGHGSTFTVILPIPTLLLPAPVSEHPAPESEPPPSARLTSFLALPTDMLAGTTLLVVDDEADARDALVSLLERYGALVRTAASVTEAMVSLTSDVPDVLISDLGMSGDDGYELIRRVRQLPLDRGGRLPSLAVSAYATHQHRKKVMSSGFQAYLMKPVAPFELVTEIAHLRAR